TALDARCAMAAPKGGNPLNLGSVSLAAEGPAACELGAGAHSEFGVHTRERSFHRSRCDVECRGHFAVRPPFGDELGDTSLRRRRTKFPESDERLDVVGDEANRTRLANAGSLDALDERAEALVCVGGSVESELEQAERPEARRLREHRSALGEIESHSGGGP